MKTEHTRGPWSVKHDRWIYATVGEHAGEIMIAPTYWTEGFPVEAAANLRLASAAPDLLAALQDLLGDKYLSDPLNADRMASARAAVAKATGVAP